MALRGAGAGETRPPDDLYALVGGIRDLHGLAAVAAEPEVLDVMGRFAFNGGLVVPLDVKDTPVAKILERLRACRIGALRQHVGQTLRSLSVAAS